MTLRQRLALTTVAVGIPLVMGSAWYHRVAHERATEDALSQLALVQMQSGGRERCEAAPQSWIGGMYAPWDGPGHLPRRALPQPPQPHHWWEGPRPTHLGLQMYAYRADGTSENPAAPILDEPLHKALVEGKGLASTIHKDDTMGCVFQVLTRMPWGEGPCPYVLVCRADEPGSRLRSPILPPWEIFLVPLAIALLSLFLAMGPVVRRIRVLTKEVLQAAKIHYSAASPITVDGSDEVGALAQAFNDAAQEIRSQMARQLEREKTLRDFLENTTHDVMIPLTVLQGHLASLSEGIQDATLVQSACNEAHYIASLVHNLGVAAKLETGEPNAQQEPVNLGPLVHRAVTRHQPLAKQRGVQLEFSIPETPPWVRGDVTLIEQAVSNVIYNAVRYNRTGGHAAITLEQRNGGSIVSVIDDGPGIDEADLSRLMERYFRGNAARSRDPNGHGLGLNIAYRVCKLHGWELRLSRSEFNGLRVDFIIPETVETPL